MRLLLAAVIAAMILGTPMDLAGVRGSDEAQIRALEAEESEALLRSDAEKLDALWDDSLTVNSPLNTISRKADVLARIRDRSIAYESFARSIDEIVFFGDTAVVMGMETGVPAKSHVLQRERISRRFTNIWMRKKGIWREVARHASLICN